MGNADLPSLRDRDVIRAFERLGCVHLPGRGKGSHTVLRPPNGRIVTIPHGRDVGRGLLAKAIRQAGFTNDEFRDAL